MRKRYYFPSGVKRLNEAELAAEVQAMLIRHQQVTGRKIIDDGEEAFDVSDDTAAIVTWTGYSTQQQAQDARRSRWIAALVALIVLVDVALRILEFAKGA